MRQAHGTVFEARGKLYASVIVAPKKRLARNLIGVVTTEGQAHAWASALQKLVDGLRELGRSSEIEAKIDAALEVGRTDPRNGLERVHGAIKKLNGLRAGAILVAPTSPGTGGAKFKAFAKRWTSGELHRLYPDHIEDVTHDKNVSRLKTYIYPVIGDSPLTEITIEQCQDVLRRIPSEKSRDTRRHVAQLMVRVFNLAVYPCRLLQHSPLPRGFLPKRGPRKALSYLYPKEDAALLACIDVPLVNRMLYGFLSREGMRSSEALSLTWSDVDLDHSAIRLDENKTDDARAWALDPGVIAALTWWRTRVPHEPGDIVFTGISNPGHLADAFRAHLQFAGVTRPELYERSKARRPIRVHDCRATFITLSLANDKTEGWVTDRTGHKSSGQVATYRRMARTAAELRLGPLLPLDKSIPEIRKRKTAS